MSRPLNRFNLATALTDIDFGASQNWIWSSTLGGWLICFGETVPSDADTGYAGGCIWIKTGATAGFYINDGDGSSCDFNQITSLSGTTDFGAGGIATDAIAESSAGAGVTIDGVLVKDYAVQCGSDGHAGSLTVYPATSNKGYFGLTCTNQTGDTAVVINADAMGQASTFHLADPGAAAAYIVTSTAALALAEVDVLQDVTAGTVTASKALVVDANKDLASLRNLTATTQITAGVASTTTGSLRLYNSGAAHAYTLNMASPTQATTVQVPDQGANATTYIMTSSTATTPAEGLTLQGITPGTVAASKAVVVDASKDIASFRNLTCTTQLTAGVASTTSGSLRLYNSGAAHAYTLNMASPTQATTVQIPDQGANATTYVVTSSTATTPAEGLVLQGVTAGTVAASKAVVVSADKDISSFRNLTATTQITAGVASTTSGSIRLYNAGGAAALTLGTAAPTQACALTIPDVNSATANVALSTAALTLAEVDVLDAAGSGTAVASKAVVLDANKDFTGLRNVGLGAASTLSGSLLLYNSGSAFAATIGVASLGQDSALTLPDCGAASANFVLSEGAATINGAKTFGSVIACTAGAGTKNGANVTVVEQGSGALHRTVLTFTAQDVTITDGGAGHPGVGSLKIYTFPEGWIHNFGIVTDLEATAAANISVTWSGDWAIGSTANAGDTIEGTELDLLAESATAIAIGPAVGSVLSLNDKSEATEQIDFDGTAGAKEVYINVLVDDADCAGNSTISLTGTVVITWVNLGDY